MDTNEIRVKLATLISKGPATAAEYLDALRALAKKQDATKAVRAVIPENLMKKIRPLRAKRKPKSLAQIYGRSPTGHGTAAFVLGD